MSAADPRPVSGLPDSTRALLSAVTAISSDLDLHRVLDLIVESACLLTGARYGALGVLGPPDELVDFVTRGIDPELHRAIGDLPHGRGILGVVIEDPRPLRLADLGQHPQSFGFPPNHPPMTTFLGVPITVQGAVFGNLYLTEKSGGEPFTEQDEELVLALAGTAGYVIANARAYGLSERRRQWLEATSRLDESLQPPVSESAALQEITNTVRSVSGAAATAVIEPRGDRADRVLAADGPRVDLLARVLEVVDERLTDLTDLPDATPVEADGETFHVVLVPLRSALVEAPLVVAVLSSEAGIGDAQERQLLQSFADHAALTLDRARALEERQELALVSDRDRIARDLHDLVIQRLFATGMQLQGMRMLTPRDDLAERLDKAVDDIDLTIKDIRATIFELQHRRNASLRGDVRTLVKEYVPLLGFTPAVRTVGPVDTAVPEKVQEELLAVLREALSNIARHALADSAAVELEVSPAEATLRVSDDGAGLADGRHESGLRNARRRAAALGGTFELGSREPHGTVFTWRVPLDGVKNASPTERASGPLRR